METLIEVEGHIIKADVERVKIVDLPAWRKERDMELVRMVPDVWPPQAIYRRRESER